VLTGPRNSYSQVIVVGTRTTSSDAQWVKEAGMSALPLKLVPISLLPVQGAHRRIYVRSIRPLLRITVRSRGTILVTWQTLIWSDGVAISAWWPHLEELNLNDRFRMFSVYIASLLKNFPVFRTSGSVRVYIGAYLVASKTMHSTTTLSLATIARCPPE